MSYFHKTLLKLYRQSDAEERVRIIDEHIEHCQQEFKDQERLRELMKEYYDQLERIKQLLLPKEERAEPETDLAVRDDGHKKVKMRIMGVAIEGDPVINEIVRAHDMILEIEKLITQIYGETHKFLE